MPQWKVTIFKTRTGYSGRFSLLYNGERSYQSFNAGSRAELLSWFKVMEESVEDAAVGEAAAARLASGKVVTSGGINPQARTGG